MCADPEEVCRRFGESLGLPYPLVGDPRKRIIRSYGVAWPLIGLARRVTYVIGRDLGVRLAFWSELDVDAHVARALEALAGGGAVLSASDP